MTSQRRGAVHFVDSRMVTPSRQKVVDSVPSDHASGLQVRGYARRRTSTSISVGVRLQVRSSMKIEATLAGFSQSR